MEVWSREEMERKADEIMAAHGLPIGRCPAAPVMPPRDGDVAYFAWNRNARKWLRTNLTNAPGVVQAFYDVETGRWSTVPEDSDESPVQHDPRYTCDLGTTHYGQCVIGGRPS